MARKVVKKLERVVSTKILQSEYDRIMKRAKDFYPKGKPNLSGFLRHLISKEIEGERPIPPSIMDKDLARFLCDGTTTTEITEMVAKATNYAGERFLECSRDSRTRLY